MIFGKATMKLDYLVLVGGAFILCDNGVNAERTGHQKANLLPEDENKTDDGGRRRLGLGLHDLNYYEPTDLVDTIVGEGVIISNVAYTGALMASGTFSGGASTFGFDSGILLTSGYVANIAGPNEYIDITGLNLLGGDADLDALVAPYPTWDATVLEFDFECSGLDNIHFEYVFGSDEYNEYVNTSFNDVFGFFLNGVNVALIPGTSTPVAINNVNCGNPYNPASTGTHCDKYVNNDLLSGVPLFDTELDGFTTVFEVDAPLQAGVNHIKLAIADTADPLYDSAVFIKEGSFSCKKPKKPVINGDPHIKTWSGMNYDFHGVCDLVLLQNPGFQEGLGMTIHVRTKQLKQFSYVSSAVVQIGVETLEVMGDVHGNLYWINKESNGDLDKGISGYPILHTKVNSQQHAFTVDLGGDKSIVMKTFKKFVYVGIEGATDESFGTSFGLLGSYGSGKMVARDNITVFEDANTFGQEWQVLPSEGMLFHNVEGPQAPAKCEIPVASNLRRRLAESNLSEEEAEIACARLNPDDFDMCVFDVMVTGDREVVGAY